MIYTIVITTDRFFFQIHYIRLLEETSLVPSTKYQSLSSPEIVHLIYTDKEKKSSITKSFVLDNGRLQLDPVLKTFDLSTLELIIGNEVNCLISL